MSSARPARKAADKDPWVGFGITCGLGAFVLWWVGIPPLPLLLVTFLCGLPSAGKPQEKPMGQEGRAWFAQTYLKAIRNPFRNQFGFSPTDAKGVWPPSRVSSWALLAAAIAVSCLPSGLPALNGLALYLFGQAWAYTVRNTVGEFSLQLGEENTEPAVCFNFDAFREVLATRRWVLGAVVVIGLLVGGGAWVGLTVANPYLAHARKSVLHLVAKHPFLVHHLPLAAVGLIPRILVGAALCFVVWSIGLHRLLSPLVLGPLRNERKTRKEWQERWEKAAPSLGTPWWVSQEGDPQTQGSLCKAIFAVPEGGHASAYFGLEKKLSTVLGTDTVLVSPMPLTNEMMQAVKGTIREDGFELVWSTSPLGPDAFLRRGVAEEMAVFSLRAKVAQVFTQLKLGTPSFIGHKRLHGPESPPLWETRWGLPETTSEDVLNKAEQIAERLGAPYVRLSMSVEVSGRPILLLLCGNERSRVTLMDTSGLVTRFLDRLDWERALRICGLRGAGGRTPRLIEVHPAEFDLEVAEFASVDGLPTETVIAAQPKLVSTLRKGYVACEPSPKIPGGFHIVTGESDPLGRTFDFADYATEILREPGEDHDMTVMLGVAADGSLLEYDFLAAEPHLVVAGATGRGKSVCVHSILLQLLHKHTPDQLEVWMADPKNELQRYRSVPHVKQFVDSDSPGDYPANQVVGFMLGLKAEMDRRINLFKSLPGDPQKLSEVHEGMKSGRWHLDEPLPYILAVVDECADYFEPAAEPPDKEEAAELKANSKRVIATVELLARKARSLGVYLLLATQRPTKATVPTSVKSNARRVGFGTNDLMSSMVIIDQPGLETIKTPGRGMASTMVGYRQFRSFWLPPDVLATLIGDLAVTPSRH